MKKIENHQNGTDFDFDQWMKLAKEDPETFEKQRLDIIQTVINEAPAQMHQRLNGLQWHIDGEIKLAKNPMDACLKIYQMMMDSVYQPGGLLEALTMTDSLTKSSNSKNVIQLRNNTETGIAKK
jgi:hypothetical protein